MKILIDNGHGENTPGKRSPDGSLREYAYAREIADRIAHELSARGYDAERIVRETVDVPLSERARRVNEVCGRYGTANVVLVSIPLQCCRKRCRMDERKRMERLYIERQDKG